MTGWSRLRLLSIKIESFYSHIPKANLTYEYFLLMRDFSHLRLAAFVSIKIESQWKCEEKRKAFMFLAVLYSIRWLSLPPRSEIDYFLFRLGQNQTKVKTNLVMIRTENSSWKLRWRLLSIERRQKLIAVELNCTCKLKDWISMKWKMYERWENVKLSTLLFYSPRWFEAELANHCNCDFIESQIEHDLKATTKNYFSSLDSWLKWFSRNVNDVFEDYFDEFYNKHFELENLWKICVFKVRSHYLKRNFLKSRKLMKIS